MEEEDGCCGCCSSGGDGDSPADGSVMCLLLIACCSGGSGVESYGRKCGRSQWKMKMVVVVLVVVVVLRGGSSSRLDVVVVVAMVMMLWMICICTKPDETTHGLGNTHATCEINVLRNWWRNPNLMPHSEPTPCRPRHVAYAK